MPRKRGSSGGGAKSGGRGRGWKRGISDPKLKAAIRAVVRGALRSLERDLRRLVKTEAANTESRLRRSIASGSLGGGGGGGTGTGSAAASSPLDRLDGGRVDGVAVDAKKFLKRAKSLEHALTLSSAGEFNARAIETNLLRVAGPEGATVAIALLFASKIKAAVDERADRDREERQASINAAVDAALRKRERETNVAQRLKDDPDFESDVEGIVLERIREAESRGKAWHRDGETLQIEGA